MYSDQELENISRSCLLICAFLAFAKSRARSAGARGELRFFSEGRDRFLLDVLHERHLPELAAFLHRRLVEEAALRLSARFRLEYGPGRSGFWTGLAADFEREFNSGRVTLSEISWE